MLRLAATIEALRFGLFDLLFGARGFGLGCSPMQPHLRHAAIASAHLRGSEIGLVDWVGRRGRWFARELVLVGDQVGAPPMIAITEFDGEWE